MRGKDNLTFDVPVIELPDTMDQIRSLVDPEKALVSPLGIIGIAITGEIGEWIPQLRDSYGIIVAARSNAGGSEVPLVAGRVIRTLNGERMTTLDGLRAALKALPP